MEIALICVCWIQILLINVTVHTLCDYLKTIIHALVKKKYLFLILNIIIRINWKFHVIVNEIVLLFAQLNEIRGVNLEQPYYNTIPTLLSYDSQALLHVQIDYLAADKKIYWSDYSSNEIKRSSLSGGNIEVILDTGILK